MLYPTHLTCCVWPCTMTVNLSVKIEKVLTGIDARIKRSPVLLGSVMSESCVHVSSGNLEFRAGLKMALDFKTFKKSLIYFFWKWEEGLANVCGVLLEKLTATAKFTVELTTFIVENICRLWINGVKRALKLLKEKALKGPNTVRK